MPEKCVFCGAVLDMQRIGEDRAAWNGVSSYVCKPCADEVHEAVEHSVRAHVIEFRQIQRVRYLASLN